MCLGLSGKVCLIWSWVKLDFLSITFSNITCNTLDTINIVLILRKFKALKFYQGFSRPRIFQFFIKANFFQIGDTKIFLRSRLFFFGLESRVTSESVSLIFIQDILFFRLGILELCPKVTLVSSQMCPDFHISREKKQKKWRKSKTGGRRDSWPVTKLSLTSNWISSLMWSSRCNWRSG